MDTVQLIKTVKEYPILYSKYHQNGISVDQKNTIWREIAAKIHQPVDKCKAKWRNLRDSYQRSVKWKQELEEIGKLSNYKEYKHEVALSFLEVSTKRKSNPGEKKRSSKKPRNEYYDTEYAEAQYSPSALAVEFLIESGRDSSRNDDDDDEDHEEIIYQSNTEAETQSQGVVEVVKTEDQNIYYETPHNETDSNHQDEIPYQEVGQPVTKESLEMDSWLAGIKETLLSLPKLERAQAKRQINNLVSDFEIKYLESFDAAKL